MNETDHVKDQLCARIEELEEEKMELNEQLDVAQQERDALSAKVEAIKAEAKDWKACAQNWEANAKQWVDDWHTVKKERDALISRITNREGLVQRAIEKEAQHDALAAHLERWSEWLARDPEDDEGSWVDDGWEIHASSPDTSLARLKAQWFTETAKSLREAEARAHLEPDEDMPLDEVDLIDMWDTSQVSDWMNEQADELRQQAEEGE